MSAEEARRVLSHWDLPDEAADILSAGGTANVNLRLWVGEASYFLKRRSPRYSALGQVAFEHRLMEHLARFRVGTSLALVTVHGQRWVQENSAIYELYPFVEGEEHNPSSLAELRSAGHALGRFHEATMSFDDRGEKAWPRRNPPSEMLAALEGVRHLIRSDEEGRGFDFLWRQADRLRREFPDDLYWSLPCQVIHGDYHPANVKFQNGEVVGIFDLDWASRQPRLTDFADGLLFFCGLRRTPLDGSDIFSLTQSVTLDWHRLRAFASAYCQTVALTVAERQALPDFLRARWVYCRTDAMRKVPEGQKLRLLLADVEPPLAWLKANAKALAEGCWASR